MVIAENINFHSETTQVTMINGKVPKMRKVGKKENDKSSLCAYVQRPL